MNLFLLPLTFQLYLQSLILFPFALIFAKPVGFKEGMLVMEWHRYFDEVWDFTTCVGCIFASSPNMWNNPSTFFHEMVHVGQYQELAVISDIIALVVFLVTGNWILALCIWGTGGPLWLLPGFLTSARYRQAWKELGWKTWKGLYMFSWFERDAYAQQAQFKRNGGGY